VCSGIGLVNIERFLRRQTGKRRPDSLERQMADGDSAAAISAAALDGSDAVCDEALDRFVSIYGAAAGNLALKLMATGGVYLGGGIAPKILPRLQEGLFMRAFEDKGRFDDLLARIPVKVILNDKTALLGAARHALGDR
jgi:glucokinase